MVIPNVVSKAKLLSPRSVIVGMVFTEVNAKMRVSINPLCHCFKTLNILNILQIEEPKAVYDTCIDKMMLLKHIYIKDYMVQRHKECTVCGLSILAR